MNVNVQITYEVFAQHFTSSLVFTGPSVPPAPSNVTINHPLLVRSADVPHHTCAHMASRVHRAGRQRAGAYNPGGAQAMPVRHYSRLPTNHAMLQR